jgi:predicted transcriptional regulator
VIVLRLHTLLAIKVIALIPGLTNAERRVAAAILDHYNRNNGICDPSVEGLAELLGLDRATVLRAIERLNELGLILRDRHGGRGHRNSYSPAWDVLLDWGSRWQAKRAARAKRRAEARQAVAGDPPTGSQANDDSGGTPATRTYLKNLPKKPTAGGGETATDDGAIRRAANGQARRAPASTHRSPANASSSRAELRWHKDLRKAFDQSTYRFVIEQLDGNLSADATTAELSSPGSGAKLILDRLNPAAHGSSQAAAPVAGISAPDDSPARPQKTWVDDG